MGNSGYGAGNYGGYGRINASAGKKPLILAVDDMPVLLSYVVKLLEDSYSVIAVTNPEEVFKVIKTQTPLLFLLDIEMPRLNGFDLAHKLREYPRFEHTPIIFLTAKDTLDDVVNAIRNGGNDYIIKPADKELLLKKIQKCLSEPHKARR